MCRKVTDIKCATYEHTSQARPITSLDAESEWELIHEFDSGIASESELITTANIQ